LRNSNASYVKSGFTASGAAAPLKGCVSPEYILVYYVWEPGTIRFPDAKLIKKVLNIEDFVRMKI